MKVKGLIQNLKQIILILTYQLTNQPDNIIIKIKRMLPITKKIGEKKDQKELYLAIQQLEDYTLNFQNSMWLMEGNLKSLLKVLMLLATKKSNNNIKWKQVFLSNLKNCIDRKQHAALLLYFKVIRNYWRRGNYDIRGIISVLSQISEGERGMTDQGLIDYNRRMKGDDKKFHFVQKVISLQCLYFSTLAEPHEQVFEHYMTYTLQNQNLIFLISFEAYLQFLTPRPQTFTPKMDIFSILNHVANIFLPLEVAPKCSRYIFNCVIYISKLLRIHKYLQTLESFSFQGETAKDLTQKVLKLLSKLDSSDAIKAGRMLVYNIMLSRRQKIVLKGIEQQQLVSLHSNSTSIQALFFLAQLHHFLIDLESLSKKAIFKDFVKNASNNIQLIRRARLLEGLTGVLELIYFELIQRKRQVYLGDLQRSKMLKPDTLSIQYVRQCGKWLPLLDLMIQIFEWEKFQNYKQAYKMHLDIKFYVLLAQFVKNISKPKKDKLLDYLTASLKYFQNDPPHYKDYILRMGVLGRLCFVPNLQDIGNQCIAIYIRTLPISLYINSQAALQLIYKVFSEEKSRLQDTGTASRIFVLVSKTINLVFLDLLDSLGTINTAQNEQWKRLLTVAVEAYLYFYDQMDEQSLQMVLAQSAVTIHKLSIFKQLTSAIQYTTLNAIHHENFVQKDTKRHQIANALEFYQRLYQLLAYSLHRSDFLSVVDLCFNLKHDIYILCDQIDPNLSLSIRKDLQNLINRVEEIEIIILGVTAEKYVGNLQSQVEEGEVEQLADVLSISLKGVFFSACVHHFYSKRPQSDIEQKFSQKQWNLEGEIQECVLKLVNLKRKCFRAQSYFHSFYQALTINQIFGNIQIVKMNIPYSRKLAGQLNDLMYIAYLCGAKNLSELLLSIRISYLKQHLTESQFVLQLSKYIFLGVLTENREVIQMRQILNKTIARNQYQRTARLLVLGQIQQDSLSQTHRLFKIIYLLHQDGITIFNIFKDIVSYFSHYLYTYPHLSFNRQREPFFKPNQKLQISNTPDLDYWVKQCWEEGWMLNKLLIIAANKVISTAVRTNQTSKVRSFLKFTLLICLRSAHLQQMRQSLVLALGKEQLNLVKLVDQLKKMQEGLIELDSFGQIEPILLQRHLSLGSSSNTIKRDKFLKMIDKAFEKCNKTGVIMGEIFFHLIAKAANLNTYKQLIYRLQSSLLRTHKVHYQTFLQDICFPIENIQSVKQLGLKLACTIVRDYSKAQAIRDYIAELVDSVLDKDKIILYSPSYHKVIDRLIVLVALIFEGYNYAFKKLLIGIPKISIKQHSPREVENCTQELASSITNFGSTFYEQVNSQIESLRYSTYPVSLFYPLGKYIFTLSFHSKLLVTFSDRESFEEKLKTCHQLIQTNEKMMKESLNSNMSKRLKLDEELGRVCQGIQIGIMDTDISISLSRLSLIQLSNIDVNIIKFAYSELKTSKAHANIYSQRFAIDILPTVDLVRARIVQQCKPSRDNNLLILIHEKYLQFPFEVIKSLRQGRGIYRIPSIQYLLDYGKRNISYSIQRCKFLVNTLKDLPETEVRFERIRQNFGEWMGIKGKVPELGQIRILLLNQEMFLYMGHGTGLEHLQEEALCALQPKSPMLVFGCSSACMTHDKSEPFGCAFTLLMKGCPAYLGCLWTVTDKDIDYITQQIFVHSRCDNLSLILESARNKCYYKYVNGSSTVVYGLPVILQRQR